MPRTETRVPDSLEYIGPSPDFRRIAIFSGPQLLERFAQGDRIRVFANLNLLGFQESDLQTSFNMVF